MKTVKIIAVVSILFTLTAVSDSRFVKRHLAALIHFSQEHHANLLVYDQYDQTRGLAIISSGIVTDIPTELASFQNPKPSRTAPSLSPDASQVAFVQSSVGSEAKSQQEIWIFNLKRTTAKKIAQYPHVISVTWSPTGDALAINAGGCQLRILVPATGQSKLIATNVSSGVASWSPDGHKLAYEAASCTGETRDFRVIVVDWETGRMDMIVKGRYPSWSPRGDRIAYLNEPKKMYLSVPPRGGQSSPLIKGRKGVLGDPILSGPVLWSPDQRYVAITGYYDGGTSITLVDLITNKQTSLNQGGDWLLASWR